MPCKRHGHSRCRVPALGACALTQHDDTPAPTERSRRRRRPISPVWLVLAGIALGLAGSLFVIPLDSLRPQHVAPESALQERHSSSVTRATGEREPSRAKGPIVDIESLPTEPNPGSVTTSDSPSVAPGVQEPARGSVASARVAEGRTTGSPVPAPGAPDPSAAGPERSGPRPADSSAAAGESQQQDRTVAAPASGSDNTTQDQPAPTDEADRARAIERAASAMQTAAQSLQGCGNNGAGTSGAGHVTVTFFPDGSAGIVGASAPFAGTPVGACLTQRFKAIRVPPFRGKLFTLQQPVELGPGSPAPQQDTAPSAD